MKFEEVNMKISQFNNFTEDSDFEIKSDEEIVNKNFTGKLSNYLIGESMNDEIRE
jgi:hypothetical protein